MTAASPAPERRRSRPGSLERPINARLYRGTWLLVGLPLLLLAFSVARPSALPAPNLPPAFDGSQAAALANDLASVRSPLHERPGATSASSAATVDFAIGDGTLAKVLQESADEVRSIMQAQIGRDASFCRTNFARKLD